MYLSQALDNLGAFTVDRMIATETAQRWSAMRSEAKIGRSTEMKRGTSGGLVRPAGRASRPKHHEDHHRNADRAEHAQRLAHEDLDLEPGQLESAQHGRQPQSRIECPVSLRNTSSSVGNSVRKSITRIRARPGTGSPA